MSRHRSVLWWRVTSENAAITTPAITGNSELETENWDFIDPREKIPVRNDESRFCY